MVDGHVLQTYVTPRIVDDGIVAVFFAAFLVLEVSRSILLKANEKKHKTMQETSNAYLKSIT